MFVNKEIDFAEFFQLIRRDELLTDQEANKKIFVNKKVEEPIIFDPNESWSQFFKSLLLFEKPKVIPISKL